MASVVVWGEVLWDRFPDGDRLGGAPANVAWHLGQLGDHVLLVTRVGDDADGRRATETLGRFVDCRLVQIDPERATGEVIVTLDSGEPRYRLVPGRAWERIEFGPDVAASLAHADAVVYGTLAQRTPEGYAAWSQLIDAIAATPGGPRVFCDVNLRASQAVPIAVARAAIASADVVKLNERELATLTASGLGDALERGQELAITRGPAGSTYKAHHGEIETKGVAAAPGGDNVGCGDAYLAMLVHGLVHGRDLVATLRAASAYAALVAGQRGATPVFPAAAIAKIRP